MTREELKKEAVSLIANNHRVNLSWGTSVGKSAAAIDMVNSKIASFTNVHPGKRFRLLVIVAEIAHKKNWIEQFETWKLKDCDYTIECYASLKKYMHTVWDFIIYDEAHHLKSPRRLEYICTCRATDIVLLSATLPPETLGYIESVYGKFATSKVSLQDSIEAGILPEPKIKLLRMHLDNVSYICTITEKWGKGKTKPVELTCTYNQRFIYLKQKKQIPDGILHIKCTQQQKYDSICEKFEYWKERYMNNHEAFAKNLWMLAGAERKRFLGSLKTKALCTLIPTLEGKRYICFCSDIDQADILGRRNAVHSKMRNAQHVIAEFNAGKRDKLFAVNMLQEGMNLKGIEVGVITQLDACERGYVQKLGRILRSSEPMVYVLYYENTRDEAFLENVLNGIDKKYIEYEDYD